jgi:hypothetical protein
MFAEMDRQQLILSGRYAAATGGSAKMAGGQLMSLRSELAPMERMVGTLKNLGTTALIDVGRGLVAVMDVITKPLQEIMKFCEHLLGSPKNEEHPMTQVLNRILNKQLQGFRNKRPGEHHR